MAHRTTAICLVCRGDLAGLLHHCPRCETPQHQDCYEYMGRCSLFGCAPVPRGISTAGAVWTLISAPAGHLARSAGRRLLDSFAVIGREWGLCLLLGLCVLWARSLGGTAGLYLLCAAAHLFLRGLHLRARGRVLDRTWLEGAPLRAFGVLFLLYPLAILTWVTLQILQATALEAASSLGHLSLHVSRVTTGSHDAAAAFLLHGGLAMLGTGILSFLVTVVSWFLLSVPGYCASEWTRPRGGPEGIRLAADSVPFASLMGVTLPTLAGLLLARWLAMPAGLPVLALSLVYLHLAYVDLQRSADAGYMADGRRPFVPASPDECR